MVRHSTLVGEVDVLIATAFANDPASAQTVASRPVFIVDDDEAVCRALGILVRSAGLKAECFTSGTAFLDAAAREVVGCAVLDVKMPGIDGLGVLAALRRAGNQVPVIFITAHDEPGLRTLLLAAGGRACLAKPVDPATLIAKIRVSLGGQVSDDDKTGQ